MGEEAVDIGRRNNYGSGFFLYLSVLGGRGERRTG